MQFHEHFFWSLMFNRQGTNQLQENLYPSDVGDVVLSDPNDGVLSANCRIDGNIAERN